MGELLEEGRRVGLAPIIRRTFAFGNEQQELFRRCEIAQPDQKGFPVLSSPCSQHEWGFAFDAQATVTIPMQGRSPSRVGPALDLFCHLFPRACEGLDPPENTAPFLLGLLGQDLGLRWSTRDAVHFAAFTGGEWSPHMRDVWGLACTTCTYPAGKPF